MHLLVRIMVFGISNWYSGVAPMCTYPLPDAVWVSTFDSVFCIFDRPKFAMPEKFMVVFRHFQKIVLLSTSLKLNENSGQDRQRRAAHCNCEICCNNEGTALKEFVNFELYGQHSSVSHEIALHIFFPFHSLCFHSPPVLLIVCTRRFVAKVIFIMILLSANSNCGRENLILNSLSAFAQKCAHLQKNSILIPTRKILGMLLINSTVLIHVYSIYAIYI